MQDRSGATVTSGERGFDLAAILLCFAWMLIAIAVALSRVVGNWGVESDFFGRDVLEATNILAGGSYLNMHYPPGYAYLLTGVSRLTGDFFTAGLVISAVSSALLGVVAYGLLKALFDPPGAILATIMILLAMVPHAFVASTDVVANLFLLIPIWLVLRHEPTILWCAAAGAAAGLAYLLRYNAVFVLAGLPLALLLFSPQVHSWHRRLAHGATVLLAALIVTSPWLLINWQRHGDPFANDLMPQIAAHFHHPRGDGFVTNFSDMQDGMQSLTDIVARDPSKVLRRFVKEVAHNRIFFLSVELIPFPGFLLLGVGLLLYLRDLTRRRAAFLMICLMGYLLHGLAGYAERFFLFLFPLLFICLILVVREVDRLPLAFEGRRWRWGLGVPLMVVLLLGSLYDAVAQTRQFFSQTPMELVAMAHVIGDRAEPGDVILALEPHLEYLTGLTRRRAEIGDRLEQYVDAIEKEHIRFVVYSKHEADYWPGLSVLEDPDRMPPQFSVIYRDAPSETILYEIRHDAMNH